MPEPAVDTKVWGSARMLRRWWLPGAVAVGLIVVFVVIGLFTDGSGALTDASYVPGLVFFLIVGYALGGAAYVGQLADERPERRRLEQRPVRDGLLDQEQSIIDRANRRQLTRIRRTIRRANLASAIGLVLLAPVATVILILVVFDKWDFVGKLLGESAGNIAQIVAGVACLALMVWLVGDRLVGLARDPILLDAVVTELGHLEGDEIGEVALAAVGVSDTELQVDIAAAWKLTRQGLVAIPITSTSRSLGRTRRAARSVSAGERAILVCTGSWRVMGRLGFYAGLDRILAD